MMSGNKSRNALVILALLSYLFLWAPIIVIVVFSFSNNKFGIRWEGFTLEWYSQLFKNARVGSSLRTSLAVALVTVTISTVIGAITAYGLYKFKFRGKKVLRITMLFPIVMPWIVTGAASLVFFTRLLRMPLGYQSILIAHITFSIPLAVFVILGRMQRIDWTLEEASMLLGANKFTTLVKITVPLLLPAILASALLIFPWSFNDFVITYFVAGVGSTTLPIYVYSHMRMGLSPIVNTIAAIFVAFSIAALLSVTLLQRNKKYD